MNGHPKYQNLIEHIKSIGPGVVAFSGGVDSALVLRAAKDALGHGVLAVSVETPYMLKWELREAEHLADSLNVRRKHIHIPFLEELKYNPKDRCYICKSYLMSRIKTEASREGLSIIMDGSTRDNLDEYRPGLKALQEQGIRSPLMETGLGKEDVRAISKEMGLPTWDRTSQACLLTRIPHDTEVRIHELGRIEDSERLLLDLGFKKVRVRSHGDLARIEVAPGERPKLFDVGLVDSISKALKSHGFRYVCMDLDGYRKRSLNAKNPSA